MSYFNHFSSVFIVSWHSICVQVILIISCLNWNGWKVAQSGIFLKSLPNKKQMCAPRLYPIWICLLPGSHLPPLLPFCPPPPPIHPVFKKAACVCPSVIQSQAWLQACTLGCSCCPCGPLLELRPCGIQVSPPSLPPGGAPIPACTKTQLGCHY